MEEATTEQIREWLRMVDKPLTRKEATKEDKEPKDEQEQPCKSKKNKGDSLRF